MLESLFNKVAGLAACNFIELLKTFLLLRMFSLASNVLVLFNDAVVTEFLKYCFGAKLIDRLSDKKHLMSLFLSVAENIRKFFAGLSSLKVNAI